MIEIDHIRAAGAEMFGLVSVGRHENLAVKLDSVNCLQEPMRPRDGVTASWAGLLRGWGFATEKHSRATWASHFCGFSVEDDACNL